MDAPNIEPLNGVFSTSPQEVTITSDDPTATIRYTTTGVDPDSSSPIYSASFSIGSSTIVKAIAIDSGTSSAITTSYIEIDDSTGSVTQDGLITWLRSDVGVQTAGSGVSEWIDVSGAGNNATQSNASYQPTLVSDAVNSLPAISFSGSSQFLELPTGFADFTEGLSIFVAMNPTSVTSEYARIINLGNNANNASGIILCEISSSSYALYTCDAGGDLSDVLSNDFTLNTYQLVEALSDGVSVGTLLTNSVEGAVNGNMYAIPNVSRTGNYIGKDTGSFGLFYEGEIAEILIYERLLSDSERRGVEVYFSGRYGLPGRAPQIEPGTTIIASVPQAVTITADDPDAEVFYDITGGAPTTPYTGPFNIDGNTTVTAIATRSGVSTPISTAIIQVDTNTALVPRSNLAMWMRSDIGVTSSSSNVSSWTDLSGSNNDATQSSGANQPTLVSSAVNGLPAISFNGSGQFFQLPVGFADFTEGLSAFVVLKPTGVPTAFSRIFQLGNNVSNASAIILCAVTTSSYALYLYNSASTPSSLASGLFTQNAFQLVEAVSAGLDAALYTNGIQGATSASMLAIDNVTRVGNFIGKDTAGGGLYLEGQIAEILLYNSELSDDQRQAVELYIAQRYGLAGSVSPPIITLPGGTLSAPSQVVICGPLNGSVRFTQNGSEATIDSPEYQGPVLVAWSQTISAISVVSGIASSSVSETYVLDSIRYPAPDPTNTTALSISLDQPSVAQ